MDYYRGKRVFITGGSSGIGLEAARMLCSHGAHVMIAARDATRIERALHGLAMLKTDAGQKILSVQMDVSDHRDVQDKVPEAVEAFGVPDILINSAGIGHADYFGNVTFEKFDEVLRINLYGTRNVVAAFLIFMKNMGGGHIVNVSSMLGLVGIFGYSAYCPSKFALVGFSECLRSELKQHNIRVSVFCPPEVDTPMTDYMVTSSPAETRALVKTTGLMSVQRAARILLKGIEKGRFLIIPGYLARWTYLNKRLFPFLTVAVMDVIVSIASRFRAKP